MQHGRPDGPPIRPLPRAPFECECRKCEWVREHQRKAAEAAKQLHSGREDDDFISSSTRPGTDDCSVQNRNWRAPSPTLDDLSEMADAVQRFESDQTWAALKSNSFALFYHPKPENA